MYWNDFDSEFSEDMISFRFPVFVFTIALLFLTSCSGSEKARSIESIESTDADPKVVVETKAAIVGGLKALQKELEYPTKAKKDGVEAVLEANVLVNKNGYVEQISFENETETDYGFEDAARNALRRVNFKAGERNGDPINMYITIPVRFEL